MSKLRMPYQCLQKFGNILVAARGSSIDTFNLEDHSLLSTWTCPAPQPPPIKGKGGSKPAEDPPAEGSESPAKRRRLSDEEDPQKLSGDEGKTEGKGKEGGKKKVNHRSDNVAYGLDAPAVISLAVARDARHVIAVTGEDKSIRVFENAVGDDGRHSLWSISQRAMPKRPCSLALTEDGSTIIAADKFGDVYSVPLLYSPLESLPASNNVEPPAQESEEATPNIFTPAANNLTVHSQRNLKALENQKRHGKKGPASSKPTFEHELLLGHVSMLTDVASVSLQGRGYIITADRDEHIRVSRGIPQTYVIESFCLGHTEFVSRLCVPQGRPDFLISGGGDGDLFVWNWLPGVFVSKENLQSHVETAMREHRASNDSSEAQDEAKVAVSSISHTRLSNGDEVEDIIIVTSEGVPALFTFQFTLQNTLKYIQTVKLPGNALAVVTHNPSPDTPTSDNSIIVSIDSIHKPGSTTERRSSTDEIVDPLHLYNFKGSELAAASTFGVVDKDKEVLKDESRSARLTNLLYNLETLRKRYGEANEVE